MKKIIIYGLGNEYGGIENVVISFINWIYNRHDVYFAVALNDRQRCKWKEKVNNPNVEYVSIKAWGSNPFNFGEDLIKYINKSDFDTLWINVATLSTLTFLPELRKISNIKIVIHAHGAGIENRFSVKGLLSRIIHEFTKRFYIKGTDNLIGCSNQAGRWMFGSKEFKIIHNGIDINKYKFDANLRNTYRELFNVVGKRVYIAIGRLTSVKNFQFTIEIFNRIVKSDPNSILFIVGDGELKNDLVSIVNNLHLEENVKFLGFRNDCNALLCASDIFLMPSLHEGFPLVSIEAQCTGIFSFVSDKIPEEAIISNKVKRIALSKSALQWTKQIMSETQFKRIDCSHIIKDNKLDLDSMCNSILNEL